MDIKEIVFVIFWAISTVGFFFAAVTWAIEEKVKNPDVDIVTHCMAAFCSPILGPMVFFMVVVMGVVHIPVMGLNFLIKKIADTLRRRSFKEE